MVPCRLTFLPAKFYAILWAIFKTGNGESGNPGIGESDKNFIGFNLIYSIYNLCNKRK
jgi:hypothetical protein